MYHLHTEPEKFTALAASIGDRARNQDDGNVYFNALLARLNATKEIITLASSIGQPYPGGKQLLYIHMAVTKDGAEMVANLYHQVAKRLYEDYEADNQPIGVMLKPTALQIRFNYYEYNGIWFQSMVLQCQGVRNGQALDYIVGLLHKAN